MYPNKRFEPKSPEHRDKIRQALLDRRSRERTALDVLDVLDALGEAPASDAAGTRDQHALRVTEGAR